MTDLGPDSAREPMSPAVRLGIIRGVSLLAVGALVVIAGSFREETSGWVIGFGVVVVVIGVIHLALTGAVRRSRMQRGGGPR